MNFSEIEEYGGTYTVKESEMFYNHTDHLLVENFRVK